MPGEIRRLSENSLIEHGNDLETPEGKYTLISSSYQVQTPSEAICLAPRMFVNGSIGN